eukprot:3295874-Rhodomonas_salina.1
MKQRGKQVALRATKGDFAVKNCSSWSVRAAMLVLRITSRTFSKYKNGLQASIFCWYPAYLSTLCCHDGGLTNLSFRFRPQLATISRRSEVQKGGPIVVVGVSTYVVRVNPVQRICTMKIPADLPPAFFFLDNHCSTRKSGFNI